MHKSSSNRVTCVSELQVRAKRIKIPEQETHFAASLDSPESIFRNFKFVFAESPVEMFLVIHLKSNNQATAFEIVTKVILNSSLVHPREVFRSAILRNAASIIIVHNHPSGNAAPSQEDLQITKQIVEAGKIMGILVLDHIIFAEDCFY